ncbi:MAG: radical SAM protein [Tannerella sp.]|jgi:radical SAM superfamily enzyme YgiQ (UPF0313 family)|nr:radical SAM protein [Tannerella sp.]
MKKKIALVSTNVYKIPYAVYPLGVSYLASYLASALPDGFEIKLFDFNFEDMTSFDKFLEENDFMLIGLSIRNFDDSTNVYRENIFIEKYKEIIGAVRARTKVPVVLGGSGFSVFPRLMFDELRPDFGVKGEGEESLRQLILSVDEGRRDIDIEGLVYRLPDGSVHINEHTRYISAPALHVENNWVDFYWKNGGMLNIQTKRGCPYKCVYCSYPLIDGYKVRTLDAKTVVANIEELYFSKGVSYFFFTDSLFNIHKDYNEELARRLIESKAEIRWGAYFSPSHMTFGDLRLYQQSGLTHVEFGTDSLSDSQLEKYNKKFRFCDIKEQSEYCGTLGLFYAHYLIIGAYGETEDTLNETFAHSKELGFTIYFPYVGMRIYPDTELCKIAINEGLINYMEELINPVYYVSKNINAGTIRKRAEETGQRWIFPDDPQPPMMDVLRKRGRKGLLWEYLRFNNI